NAPTGDQAFYLMDAASIVQDGDLNVKNNYDNNDYRKFYDYRPAGFIGMTAPDPLPPMIANTVRPNSGPNAEWYSFHYPGLSIGLVPAWYVGGLLSSVQLPVKIQLWGATWQFTGNLPLYWPATLVFMCLLGSLLG